MRRAFLAYVAGLALALATACAIHVHQRDDATIIALEATATNRAHDAARVQEVLAFAATRTAAPEDGIRIRHAADECAALERAEQVRLANVIWREKQKSDEVGK